MRRLTLFIAIALGAVITYASAAPDSSEALHQGFVMQKSPAKAILYSLAFPGLGQVYTETYWKAPLFAGAAGACIYGIIANNTSFIKSSSATDDAVAAGKSTAEIAMLRRQREYYRDRRDLSGLFLILTYVAAAIDSYTAANLYDFNVDDKLSLKLVPDPAHNGIALALRW